MSKLDERRRCHLSLEEDARTMTREQFIQKYGVTNAKYWDKLHHDNDYPDYHENE